MSYFEERIPLSARAASNRIHRAGVPQPVVAPEPIKWRGLEAHWTREEKRAVDGLPASELAVLHELKAVFPGARIAQTDETNRGEGTA